MGRNRRAFPRIRSLNFVADEGLMFRTLDVSDDGMLLEMGAPPPLGTCMNLRVAFGETLVSLPAQVMRHELLGRNRIGVGVRFRELDPRARQAIAAHVKANKGR